MPPKTESFADQFKRKSKRLRQEAPPLTDPTNKALDRDLDAQFSLMAYAEDVVLVSVNQLRPYSQHPFKAYGDEKMEALIESIRRDGLHQPIIIRNIEGIAGFEILAGHNRVEAMQRLGNKKIAAINRNLDDDAAALLVVTTNLEQRDKLLPSEKAFAYKLQMDALQRQKGIIPNGDNRSEDNELGLPVQNGQAGLSREAVANANGVNWHEIQRYIRLTYLLPELLDLLDQDRIPVMAGYELSFLDTEAQQAVVCFFFGDSPTKEKLTVKAAETLRAAFQAGQPITTEGIPIILQKPPKKKPGSVKVSFSLKELKKQYPLPDGFDVTVFLHEKLKEAFAKG